MNGVKSKSRRRDVLPKVDAFAAGFAAGLGRPGAIYSHPHSRLSIIDKVVRCSDPVTLMAIDTILDDRRDGAVRASVERLGEDAPPLRIASRSRKAARQKGRKR